MPVVTPNEARSADAPSDAQSGHLDQSLRRAQDELMAARRTRRLSNERADRLQIALEQSDTLAGLLQQQVTRARAELKDASAQTELLRSEASAAMQQSLRLEIEARHRLLDQQGRTEESLKQVLEIQTAWADRLIAAERETAQALLRATESDNDRRLADAHFVGEAAARDERFQAERERAERQLAEARLRLSQSETERMLSEARFAAEADARDERVRAELEKAERELAEARLRLSQSESERMLSEARFAAEGAAAKDRCQAERDELTSRIAEIAFALDRERQESSRLDLLAQNMQADLAGGKSLAARLTDGKPNGWERLTRRFDPKHVKDARASLALWSQGPACDVRQYSAYQQGILTLPSIAYPEDRNPYHRADTLAALLSWHDLDFVRCAYVTLLGRQPDPEGEAHFITRLRKGVSKLQLIWELRRSEEGQQHDPGIAGLDRELARFRLARVPIAGALFAPKYLAEWSPHERRFRRLENQNWLIFGSHEAASRRVDIRLEHLSNKLNEISALAGEWATKRIAAPVRPPATSQVETKCADGDSSNPATPLAVLNQFSYRSVENVRSKLRKNRNLAAREAT